MFIFCTDNIKANHPFLIYFIWLCFVLSSVPTSISFLAILVDIVFDTSYTIPNDLPGKLKTLDFH